MEGARAMLTIGAKAAAVRKLNHELGIPPEQRKMDDFTFLTRIHYLAPSDGIWGEHESGSRRSLRGMHLC